MKKKTTFLFLFFIILVVILYLFVPKFRGLLYDAAYPFLSGLESISEKIENTTQLIKDKYSLIEENRKLKEKLEILKAEIVSLRFLELENQRLREIANFATLFPGYEYISAKIIGYSPDNLSKVVFINAGEKNNISKGDLVVANGNLFGMIFEVGKFSSKVLLISDRNFKITARTRKTKEVVFYQGYDSNRGILKLVMPEQDIRIGDIVETADVDGSYPEGIPIGKISSIEYREGEFFKKVFVSIDIHPYSKKYVVVIKRRKIQE